MRTLRIAALTSTRADFGVLRWLLGAIDNDTECELLLYVSGTHLSDAFGATISDISAAGLPIARELPIFDRNDHHPDPATAMSIALRNFSSALAEDQPDLIILLGDRYEIVPVALAAVLLRIPVCHLHGGETSEGALDEYFRHAVTKLSSLHFPATEEYRRRIIRMGEDPAVVINHGAPGLDHIRKTDLLDKNALAGALGIGIDKPVALITYHPVTTEPGEGEAHIKALLDAVLETEELRAIITKANADKEGGDVNAVLAQYCRTHPDRLHLFDNLGSHRYFSCLNNVSLLIGNTSSGLIEAPSFRCPVVNVGNRQRGRLMAANIVCTDNSQSSIRAGIKRALTKEFRESLATMSNPYDRHGDGRVSERILGSIKNYLLQGPQPTKPFFDLTDEAIAHV